MKRNFSFLLFIFLFQLLLGCEIFEKQEDRKVVVRVNDSFLYEDDILDLINADTSPEDSALIVSNYITRWATQQLLIDRAELNLPEEKQREFNELVRNYRNELFTTAYTEALVSKNLDTSFGEEEVEVYFEEHKENFKLKEDLVKLRYISLSKNNNKLEDIKEWFIDFEEEDKVALDKISLQFNNFSLNDSVWIRTKEVYRKIGPLSVEDRPRLLNKDNFLELEDSLSVYLVFVRDVLEKNQQAPLEYASATIEQILLNKRRLDLTKELEKEITKDAIKNEQFEIYN